VKKLRRSRSAGRSAPRQGRSFGTHVAIPLYTVTAIAEWAAQSSAATEARIAPTDRVDVSAPSQTRHAVAREQRLDWEG
jgi:hypothetical protein